MQFILQKPKGIWQFWDLTKKPLLKLGLKLRSSSWIAPLFSPLLLWMVQCPNNGTHRSHRQPCGGDLQKFQGRRRHSHRRSSGTLAMCVQNLMSAQSTGLQVGMSECRKRKRKHDSTDPLTYPGNKSYSVSLYLKSHDEVSEVKLCFKVQLNVNIRLSWGEKHKLYF